MRDRKRVVFFNQRNVNAIWLTAVMTALMQPFVFFGYHFPDLGFLAWVHLVPAVAVAHPYGFKKKLLIFFLSLFAGLCGTLYWIVVAMQGFGGISLGLAALILAALAAFLALYAALPLALAAWINRFNKLPLFLLLPAFMMIRDYGLSHFPEGGFPWMLPAYSQGQWLKFFQWVDTTGALGLSFYIYLVNGLIADGLILFAYGRQLDKLVSRLLVVFVLALFSLYLSFLASRGYENRHLPKGSVTVALAQGNVPQDIKWDPYHAQSNLQRYLHLSGQAVKNGAEVVMWPETAYPYGIRRDKLAEDTFLDQSEMAVPLFLGAVVYDGGKPVRQHNSVLHVDRDAKVAGTYEKIHLVPFGEYLPYEKWLSRLGSVVNEVGTFDPGSRYEMFEVKGVNFGSLICFEDVFSGGAVEFAKRGADVLVNYTNDAWYEDSSAQYQHLVFSQFRALETRRPLLRVTNTGYTAVINAKGEVIDELPPFKQANLIHQLKVETADSRYARYGERWVLAVIAFAGVVFVYSMAKWWLGPVRKLD